MKTEIKLTRNLAANVLKIVDRGLVKGVGNPVPGEMCVEAAVCYALSLPHSDNPPCVGSAVRDFKINLNDCPWSTDGTRTKGLRALAIAQLGSNEIDQTQFKELLAFKGITKIQPFYIRKFADKYADKLSVADRKKMRSLADQFEAATTPAEVKYLIEANRGFGFGVGFGFGFGFGVGVGFGVGFGVGVGVGFGVAFGFGFGVGVGFGFGFGFGFGVGFGFGEFQEFFGDPFLNQAAAIGLECLQELKSPGCEWLDLL